MFGISLLLGDGFVVLPLEQTLIWALFYSTLFWLPARGVFAAFDRCRGHHDGYYEVDYELPERHYHIGMRVLPPF